MKSYREARVNVMIRFVLRRLSIRLSETKPIIAFSRFSFAYRLVEFYISTVTIGGCEIVDGAPSPTLFRRPLSSRAVDGYGLRLPHASTAFRSDRDLGRRGVTRDGVDTCEM